MSEEERLCDLIRTAFHGVTLGNGIGLNESKAIDDYEDEATQRRYREVDEKENWAAIPVSDLNRHNSSLCFVDAEGMRFLLPAYLIAELRQQLDPANPVYHLCPDADDAPRIYERFALLTDEQRRVVREFLLFARTSWRYEFDRDNIQHALDSYWKPVPRC